MHVYVDVDVGRLTPGPHDACVKEFQTRKWIICCWCWGACRSRPRFSFLPLPILERPLAIETLLDACWWEASSITGIMFLCPLLFANDNGYSFFISTSTKKGTFVMVVCWDTILSCLYTQSWITSSSVHICPFFPACTWWHGLLCNITIIFSFYSSIAS